MAIRRRTRMWAKRERKAAARELRALIKFAEAYDPMRVARKGVLQTFQMLGWDVETDFEVTEGVTVDFAIERKLMAYEVVAPSSYGPAGEDGSRGSLDAALAAKFDVVRSKGWTLVPINQDEWAEACKARKGGRGRGSAHVKRRDFLVDITLDVLPDRVYE